MTEEQLTRRRYKLLNQAQQTRGQERYLLLQERKYLATSIMDRANRAAELRNRIAEQGYAVVRITAIDDTVLIVRDGWPGSVGAAARKTVRVKYNHLPVYEQHEIAALGLYTTMWDGFVPWDAVRAIHRLKKEFGARVVESRIHS